MRGSQRTERGKEGVLVREQRQPCRHGADNVMQGKEEESTRRVVMTQALPLAVPESNSLYGVRLSPPLPDDATGTFTVAGLDSSLRGIPVFHSTPNPYPNLVSYTEYFLYSLLYTTLYTLLYCYLLSDPVLLPRPMTW